MKSMNKTTRWMIALVAIAAVAIPGGLAVSGASKTAVSAEPVYKEATVQYGDLTVGVNESGTVAIGTVSQTYTLNKTSTTSSSSSTGTTGSTGSSASSGSSSTGSAGATGATGSTSSSSSSASSNSSSSTTGTGSTSLIVETVNVAVGQVVKKGDPLMKLTDDSVTTARATLTAAVTTADLALKQATIDRDTAILKATSSYNTNKALNDTAKAEYNATVSSLTAAVTTAQNTYDKAKARIAALPGEISDLQSQLSAANTAGNTALASSLQSQITSKQTELTDTKAGLSNLANQLEKAKRSKTSGLITAQAKYDASMVTFNNAQTLYNIAMDGVGTAVEKASEALETAKTKLSDFNAFVGDGRILSAYDGTLTAVGYIAGATLTSTTAIATFQDATAVTMTVNVAQDDISIIKIGAQAMIKLSAYPDTAYDGSVSKISTSTANARTTTVSYPVTVTLSGNVAKIYSGMTGNVTFVTKQVKNVLYVSNKAIILDGTRSYAKKKNADGSITKVEVKTGFSDGYQVEIVSGLAKGDTVIIESQVTAA